MDKKQNLKKILDIQEVLKYLNCPVKDIPENILKIIDEYGFDLINDEYGTWDIYYDMLYKRKFEIYPDEGLYMIKIFFIEFKNELDKIKNDISNNRKRENLSRLKKILEHFQNIPPESLMQLELKNHLQYIPDHIKVINNELSKLNYNKTELQFKELFKHPFNTDKKIEDLKTKLKLKGYIDGSGQWVGLTRHKKELSFLYWLFCDKENILIPGKLEPQLKTFYKEFGLIVYNEKEQKGYVSIKTIDNHPGKDDSSGTYKNFETAFSNWFE